MSDLLTELLASWGTTPPNALMELVPDRLAGLVGFQKVRASGPYYEPDDSGSWCIVIPIDDYFGIADLLAVHQTGRWRLRTGNAVMLGAEALDAEVMGYGLRLFRDPLSWLRAGGDGAVILDDRAWPQLLWAANIVADDVAHGQAVRAKLQQLSSIPKIHVSQRAAVAA